MKQIVKDTTFGRTDVFKIVEKIPGDYVIWNIHQIEGHEDYLPMCQLISGGYEVRLSTLKAVKLESSEEVAFIMKFSMRTGCGNYSETKRRLSARRLKAENRQAAEKALAIFERITKF